ncbi:uncharacterized protein LOC106091577 [Stomoxys calcitrans]|uniref:uncharacterized protein LOC106091577 n=1 Tax=Stomoxys calcitrans TaxID=35570 RepID=UPI0027E35637|nr:uncharacterized protein LOC106091577 [Stomoxys calcitrans]
MVSSIAVIAAGSLQLILRVSFFIEQKAGVANSSTPSLASWLFVIAILDILLDISIFPLRYRHLPFAFQLAVETIFSVLMIEFSAMILWSTIENICCKMCKYLAIVAEMPPNVYLEWERCILGFTTTSMAFTVLLLTLYATDHHFIVYRKSKRAFRKAFRYMGQLWQSGVEIISKRRGGGGDMNNLSHPIVELWHNSNQRPYERHYDQEEVLHNKTFNTRSRSQKRRRRSSSRNKK